MAYVGRGIDNISNATILDVITFTDSAGPYNLEQGSAAFTPISAQALVISVDGVVQSPSSYTISAATITFDSVMAASSTNNFIVHNGVGLITEPSDGSVSAAKLATDAVETAKIKDLNVTVAKLPASVDLSTKTVTLPASVSGLGTGITNAQLAGSIDVTTKITGTVPTANLGSGTASSSTYLAGDQTYKEVVAIDIAWQSVVTAATLTAVAGRGYPIDTTSNACTVTLPASASVGDQIIFTDYARNWNTNAVTLNQNSLNYQGNSSPNPVYDTNGETVHIVYIDATKGWIPINDGAVSFETPQTYDAEYLIVAGGGGGGYRAEPCGGGGAGGYRTNYGSTAISLNPGTVYTVTVGTGGAGSTDTSTNGGADGVDSSLAGSDITDISATGGGGGAGGTLATGGKDGGSGGGGYYDNSPGENPGSGNEGGDGGSPSIPEGYDGGAGSGGGSPAFGSGGGGGSGGAGGAGSSSTGGQGGAGTSNSITGSALFYAAGGGGGSSSGGAVYASRDGIGGVGAEASTSAATSGAANTGSGGGSGDSRGTYHAGSGADGVVILRVATSSYSGTTSGSPTVTTDGSDTIIKFTGSGSYTG
jgi:hypothetical protein